MAWEKFPEAVRGTLLSGPLQRPGNRGDMAPLAGTHRAHWRRPEENGMNWDQIAGNWKQMKGKMKEEWGKLTDDDLTAIEGKRDQFVGKVQERYGIARDEAERRVSEWERRYRA